MPSLPLLHRNTLRTTLRALALLILPGALAAQAPSHNHPMQHPMPAAGMTSPAADTRELVNFPPMMKQHTLTSMRDHLLALAQIQEALAAGDPAQAGRIAEQRLGMSSLQAHGAHESSRHMPQKMQEIGTVMHRSASRFAIEAENAAVSGDLRPALAELARTTQACVACHAGYRLQ